MEVYFDNSATTRCLPNVAALMTKIMCEDYGNPSSMHRKGVESEQYIRHAKEIIARIKAVLRRTISKDIMLTYHYRCGRKIINFSNKTTKKYISPARAQSITVLAITRSSLNT